MRRWTLACLLLLGGCSRGFGAFFNELRGEPYALDAWERDRGEDAGCPAVELAPYAGTTLTFAPALRVTPSFVERLARFERVAHDLSLAMFGRAPTKIRHAGAYLCRPIRQRGERWSEHAFGNAVDVVGFDFPRMPRGDAGIASLPSPLERPFEVHVLRHWHAGASPDEQLREAFLHRLTRELEDADVFRGMIGPADPQHRTHLHLDMGPWRYRRL